MNYLNTYQRIWHLSLLVHMKRRVQTTHPLACAQNMDAQLEIRFKQQEPPTDDQVIQVNIESDQDPKHIFISKNLDQNELQNLIELVREYMDVFAWNYEGMPGLDPEIAQHRLNIRDNAKSVKQ